MFVSFGVAARNGGTTIMRFDDTNPQAEKEEYINSILRNVSWLGHRYVQLTNTSDYFEELFQLAVELIKRGKAYVCEMTHEEVRKSRELLSEWHMKHLEEGNVSEEDPVVLASLPKECISPYRNRTAEENLKCFHDMRNGLYDEGAATLRMKQNLLSPNANLWDQMAYRIIYKEHPKTGEEWCIYPTYDYSHCLVDSLENVTHSLCSLEFESRQSVWGSYHWLVKALDMYHAQTWEFSRCSISANVMSKRRLNKLVTQQYVSGWDDPRLLTLDGLKRRGVTSTAINTFCESIGVARSSNTVCIKHSLLEHFVRKDLNEAAPRRFAIVNPLKITLANYDTGELKKVANVPNFPQALDKGMRAVEIYPEVYIPGHKFRSAEEIAKVGKKGYKGLVQGHYAKLLYGPKVKCISYKVNEMDNIEVVCEVVSDAELKEKGVKESSLATIPWVSVKDEKAYEEQTMEARFYEPLFIDCIVDGVEVHAEKASKAQGKDFLDLLNPESMQVSKLLVEESVLKESKTFLDKRLVAEQAMAKESAPSKRVAMEVDVVRWQFNTVGYFCVDKDATKQKIVVNRIVSLKENKTLRR